MAKSFRTKLRGEPKRLQFELDGELYQFKAPKLGPLLFAMASTDTSDAIAAQFRWFLSGLKPEHATTIRTRVEDEDDDLDIDTVQEVMGYLIGKASSNNDEDKPAPGDRPTSSSSDW